MGDALAVATGYRFFPISDPESVRDALEAAAAAAGLLGTVLVAAEGVNLSLAGRHAGLDAFEAALERLGAGPWTLQRSPAGCARPFRRLRVRLRSEIVALGRQDEPLVFEGARKAAPPEWDRLLADPAVPVIDVRNRYEVAVGRFDRAVDPETDSFREFPDWVERNLDPTQVRDVAIYCTGGIRCTKAAAWMRGRGFERVHELDGGVLAYLAATTPEQSRWQGECFVFDDRVGLTTGLERGELMLCPDCGQPVAAGSPACGGAGHIHTSGKETP